MGDFVERARYLEEQVGNGKLEIGASVQQAYAAAQHNRDPYLEVPFIIQRGEMLEKLAGAAVTPEGSRLTDAAIEVADMFDEMVTSNAPVKDAILRDSTETWVIDDGIALVVSPARDARVMGKYEGIPGPEE